MSKLVSTCSRGIRKIGIFRMFLSLIGLSTIILIIMHGHLTRRDNEDNEASTTNRQIIKNSLAATKSSSSVEKRRAFDQMHATPLTDPNKGHAAHHHTPHVTQIGEEVPLFSMKTSSLISQRLESLKEKNNNILLPPLVASALDRRDYVRLLHRDELDAAERETKEQQQQRQQQQRQLPPFSSSSSISLALNRKPLGSREEEEEEEENDGGGGGGTKTMGVDPLDIQVTQHWEQITAELWSALSHGTVPTLPTTSGGGGGGGGGEGGGGEGGEGGEEEDDMAAASVAKFIKAAASGDGGNRMQELLDSDDRCSIMFELLEEEIGRSKRKEIFFFFFLFLDT